MLHNNISSRLPKNSRFSNLFYLILLITTLNTGCKEEVYIQPKLEPTLDIRGDEFELQTNDVLDLLGESCIPGSILNVGPGCNDVEYIDTLTLSLPAYPGCTFIVVYKYYTCVAALLKDYTIGDFQILSHNCSAFSNALSSYTFNSVAWKNFIDNFNLLIFDAIEKEIITQEVPPGTYPCLEALYFNIVFVTSTCYKTCIVLFSNQTASLLKISCGQDCCERHTRVCRQPNGTILKETNYVTIYPPFCETPTDFPYGNNGAYRFCVQETSCRFVCPGS